MSRIARVVIPDCPHHIIQRGNRRQRVFFWEQDRTYYLRLLKKHGDLEGISYLAYCLMDNHVHLVAVPKRPESLALGIGAAHWRYSLAINLREDWRGFLWQGRFLSCPLDEKHLYAALRYVELNPVRADLVARAEDYPWSSARAHISRTPDLLISETSLNMMIGDWTSLLATRPPDSEFILLRKHTSTGRPLGDERFIEKLEQLTGRVLRERKRGPKRQKNHLVPPD